MSRHRQSDEGADSVSAPAVPAVPEPTSQPEPADRPTLRIVRGVPSAEELAAVTALVAARSGGDEPAPNPPLRGRWNDPAGTHRRYWATGPGGWRSAHLG